MFITFCYYFKVLAHIMPLDVISAKSLHMSSIVSYSAFLKAEAMPFIYKKVSTYANIVENYENIL
jgi:hypothetical protein